MDSFSRARMPDLATNDTIHTVTNVDNNSSDGPHLPPLDVKSVIIIITMWHRIDLHLAVKGPLCFAC